MNSKFLRLMVPYFFTCIGVLITDIINAYIFSGTSIEAITNIIGKDLIRFFFASGAITNFGTIELGTRIGAIWFLPAMFFASILFQIVLKYFPDKDEIAGIISMVISLLGIITARFIWLPFSIQAGMMATFFLWTGYEIKKKRVLLSFKRCHYLAALIILIRGIKKSYCNVAFVVADMNDWLISFIVGLSGCMLIYLISLSCKGKILEYVGRNSLAVLCLHLYALETLGIYFEILLNKVGLKGNIRIWNLIVLEVLFPVIVVFFINKLRLFLQKIKFKIYIGKEEKRSGIKRDVTVDVLKGMLIISMLIGYFQISENLRVIIYSCHMIAFVFLSGYFYKDSRCFIDTLKKMVKSFLFPYIIFITGIIFLNIGRWNIGFFKETIKRYFLGMSFSNKIFMNIESVGPVYFILLLFIVRLLYMAINKMAKNEWENWGLTLAFSILGRALGNRGFWLPWSVDIALYCVIFYRIGVLAKRKGVIQFVKGNYYLYFLISPIWAYMIYMGGMEIATRYYGQYGMVLIGSIMGVITLFIFADYIAKHMFILGKLLQILGQASIIVLIIHTLVGSEIIYLVAKRFPLDSFTNMSISMVIQLMLAVIVYYTVQCIKMIKI